jgi:general secretion pathway protein N
VTGLRRLALFLLAFALLLIACVPLRFALNHIGAPEAGLSAAKVEGAVWSGRLESASFRGVQLGDVDVSLRPLPLLLGRSRMIVETVEAPGRAVLVRDGARAGVTEATATAPIRLTRGPAPLSGQLRLQEVAVLFREGACETAEGRVTTDILSRNADFLQWQGPELTAQIACRGRALLVPFRGARDGTEVNATLSIEANGRYRLETRVITGDAAFATALALAGFQRRPEGLTRFDAGRLR